MDTNNCFFLNSFGGQHLLVELAELLGHQDLLEGIARHAEFFIAGEASRDGMRVGKEWKFHWASILPFLACAYRSTGKPQFVQAIARAFEKMDVDFGHLERLLREFIEEYYHTARPHQGLDGDTPIPQSTVVGPITGPTKLISTPILGGLHHRYRRVAA